MRAIRDIADTLARSMRPAGLFSVLSVACGVHAWAFDPVVPGRALEFPRDFGAHPGHRIEWWYVTGQVEEIGPRTAAAHGASGATKGAKGTAAGATIGFQVTFFRVRNPDAESNPSRFAPKQLLFAHAALADPARGRLVHAQKSARMLEGLVEAGTADTSVRLDDWTLAREGGAYRARIASPEFTLDLAMQPTQPVLLQGEGGFSRKGPAEKNASYYYSEPHLAVTGRISAGGAVREVRGLAWLDHEWSSEYLAPEAEGWDWVGANLDGGGALMAFRIRARDGSTLWSSASLREPPTGPAPGTRAAQPPVRREGRVDFRPLRTWKSPRTGVSYPVAMEVRVGERRWTLEPLMDDQELDARASTGTLYWEGAVRLRSSDGPGGAGYLELTGYGGRPPL